MAKLHAVALFAAERLLLQQTIKQGTASARTTTRARILVQRVAQTLIGLGRVGAHAVRPYGWDQYHRKLL